MPASPCERWAAIRLDDKGQEYIDLSTLSTEMESARRVGDRTDTINRQAIRRGLQQAFVRIASIEIREIVMEMTVTATIKVKGPDEESIRNVVAFVFDDLKQRDFGTVEVVETDYEAKGAA